MYFLLFLLALFAQTLNAQSCSSDTWTPPPGHSRPHQTTTKKGQRNKIFEGGWDANAEDKAKWAAWLDEYKKNKTAQEAAAFGDDPDLVNDKTMPEDWKGYGVGLGGMQAPPWAVFQGAHGKPDLCFLDYKKGPCKYSLTRWGFNPFQKECQKFNFSGCGGNDNNFWTKALCEVTCAVDVATNCKNFG